MRTTYWQKIEAAKAKGMTTEQIERIENLEAAIAHYQDQIDEWEKEIGRIEEEAKRTAECRS